jgi:hypothetical protein
LEGEDAISSRAFCSFHAGIIPLGSPLFVKVYSSGQMYEIGLE